MLGDWLLNWTFDCNATAFLSLSDDLGKAVEDLVTVMTVMEGDNQSQDAQDV